MEVKRICKWCGKPFIAKKTTTSYCSHQCSVRYAHPEIPRFIINSGETYAPYNAHFFEGYEHIKEKATKGIDILIDKLIEL